MTWSKLGDELPDDAADLTDAAFRTHVEALCWSNRRLLDLTIPKRDLRRFAFSADADQGAKELTTAGWWTDNGDSWWVGAVHPEWQRSKEQVLNRREQNATAQERRRRHRRGDHSLCLDGNCLGLSADDTSDDARDD